MAYFLNSNRLYEDSEHGEVGLRVRTSYDTYTVLLNAGKVIITPRGEEPTSYEVTDEPFNTLQTNRTLLCMTAVLVYEVENYGSEESNNG